MRRSIAALRRQGALGVVAGLLLLLLVAAAVLAPLLLSEPAERSDVASALQGPSAAHWLGTDDLGRDNLARVMVATRLSLLLALGAAAIGVTVGLTVGSLALLPRIGSAITAAINVAVAFPGLLLALFFATIFGLV